MLERKERWGVNVGILLLSLVCSYGGLLCLGRLGLGGRWGYGLGVGSLCSWELDERGCGGGLGKMVVIWYNLITSY